MCFTFPSNLDRRSIGHQSVKYALRVRSLIKGMVCVCGGGGAVLSLQVIGAMLKGGGGVRKGFEVVSSSTQVVSDML